MRSCRRFKVSGCATSTNSTVRHEILFGPIARRNEHAALCSYVSSIVSVHAGDASIKNTRQVACTLKTLMLKPNDWVPNNRRLPVIIYESAISVTDNDPAALFEKIFSAHGWPPQWRDGVYDYHHYHTEGHEVLGVVSGQARLMLGGPDGQVVEVKKEMYCCFLLGRFTAISDLAQTFSS